MIAEIVIPKLISVSAILSHQARYIDPWLDQCLASVVDGGPTLIEPWVNVSCLWGYVCLYVKDNTLPWSRFPSGDRKLTQCYLNVCTSSAALIQH